jgi:hypothetical protein
MEFSPTTGSKLQLFPLLKNGKTALVNNHTAISTLNTFSRYFKLSHISTFRKVQI